MLLVIARRRPNVSTYARKTRVAPERVYVASTPVAAPTPVPVSAPRPASTINTQGGGKNPAKKTPTAVVGGQVSAQQTGDVSGQSQQQQQKQPDGMTLSIQSSQQMYESQQQAPVSPNPPLKMPLSSSGDAPSLAPPSYDASMTGSVAKNDEFVPIEKSLV
jgi:hypothetical protein